MIITTKLLERKDACISQVELFQATFGDEAEVTLENCLRAAAAGQDFDWAARHLLSATARKMFDETVAPARKMFDETVAKARKMFDETVAPARKQYGETVAVARKLFNETVATARELLNEARGRAFFAAATEL